MKGGWGTHCCGRPMTAEGTAAMGTRAPSLGDSRARTGCIPIHKQCGTAHVLRSPCPIRMVPRYHVIGCGIHGVAVCMHCMVAGPRDSRLRGVARRHWPDVLLRQAISQPVHSKLLLPRRSFEEKKMLRIANLTPSIAPYESSLLRAALPRHKFFN